MECLTFPLAPEGGLRLIDRVIISDASCQNRRRAPRWPAAVLGAALGLVPLRVGAQAAEPAADFDFSLENLVQQADAVLQDLRTDGRLELPEPDPTQMDDFFRQLQSQLEGEYVLDLVPFKRTADFLLPLLEAHEPLQDLGAWLRSRRDYFDVLDELTIRIPAPGDTNAPSILVPPPEPQPTPRVPTVPPSAVQPPTSPRVPPPAADPSGGGKLTNRVTVEVLPDEAEPVPVRVVIVPAPNTVPPAPRPPTQPGAAPPAIAAPPPPSPRREIPSPAAIRAAWHKQMATRDQPAGAQTWVPRLKPLFLAAGIPAELVWLAEVESGFDPRARSPAGAVGLYQLMPITARSLGLSTFPFDERKNPEKSSRAAAKYLRQLHEQFGDWPLALAAYNAGPTRVQNLLTGHRAGTFGEVARHLPAETQLYVPKFEAVLYRREGLGWQDLKTVPGSPGVLNTGGGNRPPK